MKIFETERLGLRELDAHDDAFILQLVNEPTWLRFIGDRNIRTLEAAQAYIVNGPVKMYGRFGFGLWMVERREDGVPVGICGLIKRDSLEDIDLGFAFLPTHWRKGYAFESAAATMAYGAGVLGLKRVVAILSPDNVPSSRLLEKLGFRFERMIRLSDAAPEVMLYAANV